MIQLYNAHDDETMDETSPGVVYCDGVRKPFEPGRSSRFRMARASRSCRGSTTVLGEGGRRGAGRRRDLHDLGAETDNRFGGNARRFVPIEEDVAPTYLLNIDYPQLHEVA